MPDLCLISKSDVVLGLTNATGGEDVLEYVAVWSEPNTNITMSLR